MDKEIRLNKYIINFGVPIVLLGILIFIMKSSLFHRNDTLSLAITVDLLITIPLIYFLLIRKTTIPNTTVIALVIIGLLIGTFLLPKEDQTYLNLFKTWALPIIELSLLTILIFKVKRAIIKFKEIKGDVPDFYDSLKSACSEILPKTLVSPFATEIAVFYYGFINWKQRKIRENEFTYHKNSGTQSLFGGIILILIIETIGLHFLLLKWSPIAAWILTGLSIYTGIQVFGIAKSLSKRPISFDDKILTLRYGIMNESQITFSEIESIQLNTEELTKDKFTKTLSPLGELEGHNVIIHLTSVNTLTGLYGIKKKYKVIALFVDEPVEFNKRIQSKLGKIQS